MSGLGLIFAGLGGTGESLNRIGAAEQKAQQELDLRKEISTMELEKAKAIEDYKDGRKVEANKAFQAKVDDLTAERYAGLINSKFGSSMTGEDAKGLLGNDAARKEYGIADMSDDDRLKLQAEAAARMGDSDRADSINKQITTQQHHEDSMKRLDATLAATEAAANRAWEQNDDANKRAQANVHLEEAKLLGNEIKSESKTLADMMNAGADPKAIADQKAVITDLQVKTKTSFDSALSILNGDKGKADGGGSKVISAEDYFKQPAPQDNAAQTSGSANKSTVTTSGSASSAEHGATNNSVKLQKMEAEINSLENQLKTKKGIDNPVNPIQASMPWIKTEKDIRNRLNELYQSRALLVK